MRKSRGLHDVIIVGAGLAGVSAAFELSERGYRVLLLEARNTLGGRTASWNEDGMPVESGLHRFLGFYHELPNLLKRSGVNLNDILCWEDEIEVRTPDGGPCVVIGFSPIHKPIKTLDAIFTDSRFLTLQDKAKVVSFFSQGIAKFRNNPLALDRLSVFDMAREHNLSERVIQHVLVPLTAGLFFLPPEEYSAFVFFNFANLMVERALELRLGAFTGGMTEVMINPIIKAIKKQGGTVLTGKSVRKLLVEDGTVYGVEASNYRYTAQHVLLATTVTATQQLTHAAFPNHGWFLPFYQLKTMPAVTIQIDTDQPIAPVDRTTFCPGTIIATFSEQSRTTFPNRLGRTSIILSPPKRFLNLPKETILEAVLHDADRLNLPLRNHITDYRIIVHPTDFYRLSPGMEQLKPTQETPIPGLTLAGDYTKQTFLATMEGAVISGKLAANTIV